MVTHVAVGVDRPEVQPSTASDDAPMTAAVIGGAFAHVIDFSFQFVVATRWALYAGLDVLGDSRSVADVILPVSPRTSKSR